MFGKGRIELQKIDSAVMIPAAAIVKREGAEVVFVQEGEKAKMVAITRKLTQNDRVQVDGVVPGQNLIVQGQAGLVDGSKIRTKQEVAEVPAKKEL